MKLAKERGHGKHKLNKHGSQSPNQQSPRIRGKNSARRV